MTPLLLLRWFVHRYILIVFEHIIKSNLMKQHFSFLWTPRKIVPSQHCIATEFNIILQPFSLHNFCRPVLRVRKGRAVRYRQSHRTKISSCRCTVRQVCRHSKGVTCKEIKLLHIALILNYIPLPDPRPYPIRNIVFVC
jgi:hypothetical protein